MPPPPGYSHKYNDDIMSLYIFFFIDVCHSWWDKSINQLFLGTETFVTELETFLKVQLIMQDGRQGADLTQTTLSHARAE